MSIRLVAVDLRIRGGSARVEVLCFGVVISVVWAVAVHTEVDARSWIVMDVGRGTGGCSACWFRCRGGMECAVRRSLFFYSRMTC